jgi:hypothetical protein
MDASVRPAVLSAWLDESSLLRWPCSHRPPPKRSQAQCMESVYKLSLTRLQTRGPLKLLQLSGFLSKLCGTRNCIKNLMPSRPCCPHTQSGQQLTKYALKTRDW